MPLQIIQKALVEKQLRVILQQSGIYRKRTDEGHEEEPVGFEQANCMFDGSLALVGIEQMVQRAHEQNCVESAVIEPPKLSGAAGVREQDFTATIRWNPSFKQLQRTGREIDQSHAALQVAKQEFGVTAGAGTHVQNQGLVARTKLVHCALKEEIEVIKT